MLKSLHLRLQISKLGQLVAKYFIKLWLDRMSSVKGRHPGFNKIVEICQWDFWNTYFLSIVFPCHCPNNTELIKPPSILIWKIIQFYGSATTAEMITTGRLLLLVKCSSLEFEIITWALYQYWVGRFISLALEFTTCNITEICRVFRVCDLVQSSQTCWWTRFW